MRTISKWLIGFGLVFVFFVILFMPLCAMSSRISPIRTIEYSDSLLYDIDLSKDDWNSFVVPQSLTFEISPTVEVKENLIISSGKLINSTQKDVKIKTYGFPLVLDIVEDSNIKKNPYVGPPMPPQVPLPPLGITVPKMTQIIFDGRVYLGDYNYVGSPTAEVAWSFKYWSKPIPKGRMRVVLPYREKY